MIKNQKNLIESILKNVSEDTLRKVPREKAIIDPKVLALCYNSYDPSLTTRDFANLMTQRDITYSKRTPLRFDVIKRRDPKYFNFRDQYILLFQNNMDLRQYLQETRGSSINRMRVDFRPLLTVRSGLSLSKDKDKGYVGDHLELLYRKYCRNLEAAYLDREEYFKVAKENVSEQDIRSEPDLRSLVERVTELEKNCAIVWNLPRDHEKLVPQISFFDIVHSFNLYWNQGLGKSLRFMRFSNAEECKQFKKNYHGFVYDKSDTPNENNNKILVEPLGM